MTSLSEYLQAKRKLVEAATPGPWIADGGEFEVRLSQVTPEKIQSIFGEVEDQATGDFIADARTTYPKLLAALESALGALEELRSLEGRPRMSEIRPEVITETLADIERILEVKP